MNQLGFVHRYVPGHGTNARVTLLLLHGTGGDEDDLVPIGRTVLPGAALLSPRGKVLENGAPRFFRRLAEGVFDLPDLVARTRELADFLRAASAHYGFDRQHVISLGFSNGANIAGALLLLEPGATSGAVLLRPMTPLVPERAPDLTDMPVFVAAGLLDPLISPTQSEALVALLQGYGARVMLHWVSGGHAISASEVSAVRGWLELEGAARRIDSADEGV